MFKAKVALAVVVVGAVTAGIAIAGWTGPGQGEGYAKATRWQMLVTEDASARTVGDIYPGGTGDLYFTWDNPNPFPVRITEIRAAGPFVVDPEHPECVNHGLNFNPQLGLEYDIGLDSSAGIIITGGGLTMAPDSDDGCQGASFTLPVVARGIVITDG